MVIINPTMDIPSRVYGVRTFVVRDHRGATRSRRRSWRSVSLSLSIFLWTWSPLAAIHRPAV